MAVETLNAQRFSGAIVSKLAKVPQMRFLKKVAPSLELAKDTLPPAQVKAAVAQWLMRSDSPIGPNQPFNSIHSPPHLSSHPAPPASRKGTQTSHGSRLVSGAFLPAAVRPQLHRQLHLGRYSMGLHYAIHQTGGCGFQRAKRDATAAPGTRLVWVMAEAEAGRGAVDGGQSAAHTGVCDSLGDQSDRECLVFPAGWETWSVFALWTGKTVSRLTTASSVSTAELSLTVPITNSLAFLFTVLGEWYVEGKVISRGLFIRII